MKRTTLSANIVKKLVVLSVIVIGVAFLIAYMMTLNIQDDVYKKSEIALQNKINERVKSKLLIAKTNSLSIASNSSLKQALKTDDREIAIKALNEVVNYFNSETDIKNLKLHLHTKDLKSFVRTWKLDKYGDDLSNFRETINAVKETKKAVSAIEVGRAGMVLRGIAPILEDGKYLGSVEFMETFDLIGKKFIAEDENLIVLTDKKYIRKDKIVGGNSFGDFVITQKVVDEDFLAHARKIDIDTLIKDGELVDDKYFYTIVEAKGFNGKKVGYYLLGTKLSNIQTAVNKAQEAVYFMILIMFFKTLVVMSSVYMIIKRVVGDGVKKFKKYFVKYVEYTTRKSDKCEKAPIDRMDEFGQLLDMLNNSSQDYKKIIEQDAKVLKELSDTTTKVAHGDYSSRIKSDTDNKVVMSAKTNINSMVEVLDENMNSIKSVLNSYINDDYRKSIDIPSDITAEMRDVMESINILGKTLSNYSKQNLEKGEDLQKNSTLMKKSINALAQKTNEQAKKLKDTSISAKEIATLAEKNTKNSTDMAALGDKVKTLSSAGEKLAFDTSTAMDEIVGETSKIAESIDIIDQIAFQTNILSLNAAVEAATAGEAGKGFAVVAHEVRNLAARSNEAAKTIKELVLNATAKAETGKDISDKMIDGYTKLNEHLGDTLKLINSVQTSSKEQLKGVQYISKIVNDLDHTTRKNAQEADMVSKMSKDVEDIAKILVVEASEKQF